MLVNGGNVEVRDLHLGYNGTGANNGIEIDKGAAATNNPTLTMNGTLTSESNQNVVRPAEKWQSNRIYNKQYRRYNK